MSWRISWASRRECARSASTVAAANVVVSYDPAVLNAEALVTMITAYDPDSAAIARWQAAQHAQGTSPVHHARRRKIEAALAAAALALSLLGGPVVVPLVYALLLGCAGSMLQRTYKGLRKERKLLVEAIAAVSMVFVGLSGALWLAALIPVLLYSAPSIQAWVQVYAPKTRSKARTAAPDRTAVKPAAPALPQVNLVTSPSGGAAGKPVPAPAVNGGRSLHVAEQALTVESLELGQTFTGVGSPANVSSLNGGTMWFVRTNAPDAAEKANG